MLSEKDKDSQIRIQELEAINNELTSNHREAIIEVQRLDRDLRQLLQVNDAFQLQTAELQRRENQFHEAARDYREKQEQLKVEQERIAMKEQQFLRQIHKIESEARKEGQRLQDKHESAIQTQRREYERSIEELEDRLTRSQDEADDLRRKAERLEKRDWEHRQAAESLGKREERLAE
jgi:chromosome segregation ATPase